MQRSIKSNLVHEDLDVQSESSLKESKDILLREDRYEAKDFECYLVINENRLEVINFSNFGVAVISKEPFLGDSVFNDVSLVLEDIEVEKISVKKLREEPWGEGEFKIALSIVSEPLNLVRVLSLIEAKELVHQHRISIQSETQIPEQFKQTVYEVKDTLETFNEKLNRLQSEREINSNWGLSSFENAIVEVVSDYFEEIFENSYRAFGDSFSNLSPDQMKICTEFFRRQLMSLIYNSPFSRRSYSKPRGYAGDYEMMNHAYRNESLGISLFSKCIHKYFLKHTHARAVRNRAELLRDKIISTLNESKAETVKILSVACGPAWEIQYLINSTNVDLNRLEVHLLDQDVEALKNAKKFNRMAMRKSGREIKIKYVHKAIKNIIARGLKEEYDFIYSIGLFDYFTDRVAKVAAKKLHSMLRDNGSLTIGNFRPVAKNKMYMELALDWSLIYRTEQELIDLYSFLGDTEVEAEAEGVNLFLTATK